ncbi:MAG: hypothetical protein IKW00_00715 [Clostridia bacterium]|nr:hypothetical protein [Clostridia bacterium]
MERRMKRVRKWVILDALVLLALSVYELISRVDAMWGPLKMFVNLAVGEKIPLDRVALYVDMGIFEAPAFMFLCALTAVIALLTVKTRRGSMILLPVCLILSVWGVFVQMSLLGELIRYVKIMPLLVMSVLFVIHLHLHRVNRRELRKSAQRISHYVGYSPVPEKIEGRRFQHGIADHRAPRRKRVS